MYLLAAMVELWNNGRDTSYSYRGDGIGGPVFTQHTSDYVQKVPMSEKDYTFNITQSLPPPSDAATLKWIILKHPGNTFDEDLNILRFDHPQDSNIKPSIMVTIPWKTNHVDDSKVFAQTIYLYWDDPQNRGGSLGTTPSYASSIGVYQVILNKLDVKKSKM